MKNIFSPRAVLIIIAAMFLLPLLLAWFMYNGTIDFKPASTRNLGTLVEPPLPMSWADILLISETGETATSASEAFNEHWVVLFAIPSTCSDPCFEQVTALRQIHRASGRHQSRIRIALLLMDRCGKATHL